MAIIEEMLLRDHERLCFMLLPRDFLLTARGELIKRRDHSSEIISKAKET
jgi:hypothetical protein